MPRSVTMYRTPCCHLGNSNGRHLKNKRDHQQRGSRPLVAPREISPLESSWPFAKLWCLAARQRLLQRRATAPEISGRHIDLTRH